MKRPIFLVSVLLLALTGCTNAGSARNVLEKNGFKNVTITGYSFLACSKDDFYHTGFAATSVTGAGITGTVCEGLLFKNSTIRFD